LPEPNEREPIDDEEDDAWAADPRWPLRHLLVDLVRARKRDVAMALLDGGLSLRRHAFPSWGARLAAQMSKDQELLLALLRAGAWIEGGPIEPGPGFEDRVLAWASNWRNDGLALAIAESGAPLDFEALRRAQRWSFFKIGWRAHPRLRAALDRAGYRPDLWERIRWRARWLFPAILLAPFAFWSMEAFTVFAVVAALFAMGRHSGENAA
jgi:hypothetical protein